MSRAREPISRPAQLPRGRHGAASAVLGHCDNGLALPRSEDDGSDAVALHDPATQVLRWALVLLACLALAPLTARAEPPGDDDDVPELVGDPLFASQVRAHYYSVLARSPTKAFLWELALPGAGHVYAGFPIQAAIAAGLSVAGAAMWIGGAVRDHPGWWWAGMGTFTAGRVYGLISAPVSAALLNAAYRRQFGIAARF